MLRATEAELERVGTRLADLERETSRVKLSYKQA